MVDISTFDGPIRDDEWGDWTNPKAILATMATLMLIGVHERTAQQLHLVSRL